MTNVQLIITLAGFVLAIFGASWLNQQSLKNYLDAKFDSVVSKFDSIDAKFESVNARFDAVMSEIRRLDQRIDQIEQRLDRIDRQLEMIFKPSLPKTGD